MWLDQRLGPALSAAAPIGFTNKHLISLSLARATDAPLAAPVAAGEQVPEAAGGHAPAKHRALPAVLVQHRQAHDDAVPGAKRRVPRAQPLRGRLDFDDDCRRGVLRGDYHVGERGQRRGRVREAQAPGAAGVMVVFGGDPCRFGDKSQGELEII